MCLFVDSDLSETFMAIISADKKIEQNTTVFGLIGGVQKIRSPTPAGKPVGNILAFEMPWPLDSKKQVGQEGPT